MEENPEELFKITQEIIEIKPRTSYLSANELITLRNNEIPTITVGLKRTKLEDTQEEQNELEKLYANLENQLTRPRIERLGGRAVGVWDSTKNLVRVERKDGKFGHFGLSIKGQLYLEFYEALFLLEVNRLQIEYNSTIMSIEQAYILLLGEQHSPKYHEYLVYSNLTRAGYIVVRYQNKHFQRYKINSEADCVWAILEAELQDQTVPDYVKKIPFYGNVKQKFDGITNKIKNQIATENPSEKDSKQTEADLIFSVKLKPNLKRKATETSQNEWLKAKRHCTYAPQLFQHSLVDFLKEEDDYKQFKEMFEKFDLIPLRINHKKKSNKDNTIDSDNESDETDEDENVKNISDFQINFDVYLHNEGYRKSSPPLPRFRIIILQPNQRFPNHDEIYATHRQQLNPVHLLIITVNDSKQMQAFLYYFS